MPASSEQLDKRYLILVLRLLVDQQGLLQYGEVVETDGQRVGRFQHLGELEGMIERWREQQRYE